jgi:hypothetical protein
VKYFLADLRPLRSRKAEEAVADRIQIIKHEAVAKCGSYEVRFSDGRPSKYFYWEDGGHSDAVESNCRITGHEIIDGRPVRKRYQSRRGRSCSVLELLSERTAVCLIDEGGVIKLSRL